MNSKREKKADLQSTPTVRSLTPKTNPGRISVKMSFLARVFRSKDPSSKKQSNPSLTVETSPAKPKWTDAWQRTEVAPEEVQDLVRGCVHEIKARGMCRIAISD